MVDFSDRILEYWNDGSLNLGISKKEFFSKNCEPKTENYSSNNYTGINV